LVTGPRSSLFWPHKPWACGLRVARHPKEEEEVEEEEDEKKKKKKKKKKKADDPSTRV
jgi:hypothetical protein